MRPLKNKTISAEEICNNESLKKTKFLKVDDVKSAVHLLDEQLNNLCCDPSLTYDEFMEMKKRILKHCMWDVVS